MEYVNTTASEFDALAARIGEGPCLYSIISNYDWHLRLCFVRTYSKISEISGQSRSITRGELEIVTNAADWFLFDTKRFPNRKYLVASNVEYGWGDKDRDYFSGQTWAVDVSALPRLIVRSDALCLEIYPYENAREDHARWHIYQEQVGVNLYYSVYRKTVKREDFPQ